MIDLFTYRLPFQSPLTTGAGRFKMREGILIHYHDDRNSVIVEASPLPGFSPDTLPQVLEELNAHRKRLNRFFSRSYELSVLRAFLKDLPSSPALQFALSYLGISLLARRNSTTIPKLMNRNTPESVRINKTIGAGDHNRIQEILQSDTATGFRTFKIKAPWPVQSLLQALHKTADSFPDITFRLDANQSWPSESVQTILNSMPPLPIQYVEEPCKPGSFNELKARVRNSAVPVALDESISTLPKLKQALEHLPDTPLIIKPMILGNFFEFTETIRTHRSLFDNVVVTSALESVVGRKMAHTAAVVAGDHQLAHGLYTGAFFASDLAEDFPVHEGSLPGLLPELSMDDLRLDLLQSI
jgi:o-succinylbenzoate synthase